MKKYGPIIVLLLLFFAIVYVGLNQTKTFSKETVQTKSIEKEVASKSRAKEPLSADGLTAIQRVESRGSQLTDTISSSISSNLWVVEEETEEIEEVVESEESELELEESEFYEETEYSSESSSQNNSKKWSKPKSSTGKTTKKTTKPKAKPKTESSELESSKEEPSQEDEENSDETPVEQEPVKPAS